MFHDIIIILMSVLISTVILLYIETKREGKDGK